MQEFTISELDGQAVELLPAKETLFFNTNWAAVMASNSSLALNAVTLGSVAQSGAWQAIQVNQHS